MGKNNGSQTDSGNKEQWTPDRQWKQRTMEARQTVETKNNGSQTDSGNKEQWKPDRQWKQRTMEGRKAKENGVGNKTLG